MDLVASCKDKLTYFRIKELKDILTQLGLSKQGKKQDLVDRILAILSDEQASGSWSKKYTLGKDEVAKLIDDTYRKLQGSGAADLASRSQAISDSAIVKPKDEVVDSYHMDKIRCLCGSPLPTDSMIKCEDPRCNVWQHIACVVIPEKPMEGILPSPPEIFYCEICRLSRADPFWVSIAHPLYPVKLNATNVPADGTNPGLSIEKTFQVTRADKDLLSKQEYDVQAWCMLLNDKVTFRMQWPQYADLQVNGVPERAINRPGSQLLGANGRDDGPIITARTRDGINKISLSGCDARIFCVGVRIVKHRTLRQILNMIPKEDAGERFEDALARVRKCVGGGAAMENADSDSDIEVVADFVPVNLRCPMSGLRIKVAGRFKPCAHMGCFDLEVFVEMNQRSRKWQCPICMKNYSWEKIIIDPYFNRITSKMLDSGEEVADIEVKPDGSWRAKAEGDRRALGELGMWHSPDGSICSSVDPESKLKEIKPEPGSDSHPALKLGLRKNPNGRWVVNRSGDNRGISPANRFQKNFDSHGHNIIPMSSSATVSGRDGEDASVNQDGGGNLDFSTVNGIEYESISVEVEPPNVFNEPFTAAPVGDAEVIVLSDSDDEVVPLIPSESVYQNNRPDTSGIQFSTPQHEIHDSYYDDPVLVNGASSCLDLYNTNDDEYGSTLWSLPSGGQGVPRFQFFSSDADISGPLIEMQHDNLNCQSSINGYTLTAETAMGSAALVPNSPPTQHSNMNADLVDNSAAFSGNDPSLQIFLPTRPSDASTVQTDLRNHAEVSNGIHSEDWISLRLGDGGRGDQGESASANDLSSASRFKTGALESLADHASFLLDMNDHRTGKKSRERSNGPFHPPRQPRSVRPKLNLSMAADSE